jgi:uncharacterized protein (TIGR02246 family)
MPNDIRGVVKAYNDAWNAAFNRGEAAAVAALYTDDATVLPHTHDVIRGSGKIREFWTSVIGAGFKDHSIGLLDVHLDGNLACEIAKWSARGPGEGGQLQSYGGSLVNIYERQSDGSWKCRLHIWN